VPVHVSPLIAWRSMLMRRVDDQYGASKRWLRSNQFGAEVSAERSVTPTFESTNARG